MTVRYVPVSACDHVFFERVAADGELHRVTMRAVEEYDAACEIPAPDLSGVVDVDVLRVGAGWQVTYETADGPVQLSYCVEALAHIPDEIFYEADYTGWLKNPVGQAIRVRLRVLVWTQSGQPALVTLRTGGEHRISSEALTRVFERVIREPRDSEIRRADDILADDIVSGDEMDRATYHFALETDGELGAVARTVADRTRSERRAGHHSDAAEFFARAGFMGRL